MTFSSVSCAASAGTYLARF